MSAARLLGGRNYLSYLGHTAISGLMTASRQGRCKPVARSSRRREPAPLRAVLSRTQLAAPLDGHRGEHGGGGEGRLDIEGDRR
jgi:hypothetical protein